MHLAAPQKTKTCGSDDERRAAVAVDGVEHGVEEAAVAVALDPQFYLGHVALVGVIVQVGPHALD